MTSHYRASLPLSAVLRSHPFLAILALCVSLASTSVGAVPAEAPAPHQFPGPWGPTDSSGIDSSLVRVEDFGERRIRLHIRSAAMRQVIAVDVLVGSGRAPRPTIYLLDGVDGGPTSGWLTKGSAEEFFADKPVDVVLTTGGTGSIYTDWVRTDAALGLNRWETFLTEELPPIVEPYLGSTGRRAAAGVSMGAQAAVMLAQRNPGFYAGVAGFSGCYSTSDQMGRAITTLTVASRGGNPENLWGPPTSPEWAAHDSVVGAERLRGTQIFLSAAPGSPSAAAYAAAQEYPEILTVMLGGGSLLEAGARVCTERLAGRLAELDIPARIEYLPEGMHAWPDFHEQLSRSWPSVAAALRVPV